MNGDDKYKDQANRVLLTDQDELNISKNEYSSDSNSFVYPADGLSFPVAFDVLKEAAATDDEGIQGNENELNNLTGGRGNGKFVEFKESPLESVVQVTLTSRRELFGWWLYYFSYAPVSAVAMILLIPLLLQDLARRAGHIYGDPSAGCTNEPGEICV